VRRGFSIIELTVVLAALALLLALAAPMLARVIEQARVARVVKDLQTVEVALEAFRTDHGRYPPVVMSCDNSDQQEVLQLPLELADGNYLPRSPRSASSSLLADPFRPRSTYKYVAPENYWMNGSFQDDRYPVWVPNDFPSCHAAGGKADDSPNSPVAWAVWSPGPRPNQLKVPSYKLPLAAEGWYTKPGDYGIIARYKVRNGATWSSLR
jgi:prepilin-type N-terminal cleavage/methylation domain-containing protein